MVTVAFRQTPSPILTFECKFLKELFMRKFVWLHYLTSNLLAWYSRQLLQETSSLNAPDPGNQASKSSFLEAAWFRAPDTMFTTRYGSPSALQNSSALFIISSIICQDALSWGDVRTNCSTYKINKNINNNSKILRNSILLVSVIKQSKNIIWRVWQLLYNTIEITLCLNKLMF